ncbi:MAG: Na+/H+ antiporter NhaA, partial [Thiotrichaceae bacterium]|nr:Na+/H+ antiporter NhaA [Thiotrichaceae bacterium]
FIGSLAFTDAAYMNQVRLGVLVGSFLSALFGYIILRMATTKSN